MVSKPRQGEVRPQLQGAQRAVPWTGSQHQPEVTPASQDQQNPQVACIRAQTAPREAWLKRKRHRASPARQLWGWKQLWNMHWVIVLVLTACCVLWCKGLITLTRPLAPTWQRQCPMLQSRISGHGPTRPGHSPNTGQTRQQLLLGASPSCPRTSEPRWPETSWGQGSGAESPPPGGWPAPRGPGRAEGWTASLTQTSAPLRTRSPWRELTANLPSWKEIIHLPGEQDVPRNSSNFSLPPPGKTHSEKLDDAANHCSNLRLEQAPACPNSSHPPARQERPGKHKGMWRVQRLKSWLRRYHQHGCWGLQASTRELTWGSFPSASATAGEETSWRW